MGAARELVRRNAHVFRAGHAYDRYSFGRTLGSGIFSTVVEGTDRVTGERVAVKVVDRTAVRSPRQEAIFLNEVDILKTVRSPPLWAMPAPAGLPPRVGGVGTVGGVVRCGGLSLTHTWPSV